MCREAREIGKPAARRWLTKRSNSGAMRAAARRSFSINAATIGAARSRAAILASAGTVGLTAMSS